MILIRAARAAILALALCGFVPGAGFAQSGTAATPRLDPDPRAFVFAQAESQAGVDGRLDWDVLLDAALWASGAGEGEALALRTELRRSIIDLLKDEKLPAEAAPRAEAVLAFLHRRFLKAYSEQQTRLDTLLKTGQYNCVSSAVLFLVAGTAAGLEIQGVATADHAFCSVLVQDEWKDVETTRPYGFDPGNRREFHDEFGRLTGFAYVPAQDYRSRRSIGALELISLILSNRIVAAESAGRFAEAVGYAVDRWALLSLGRPEDGDSLFPDAERELLERLLNYGASLAQRGRDAEALAWADRAIDRFKSHPRWDDFIHSVLNNFSIRLLQAGKYAEARAKIAAYAGRIDPSVHRDLIKMVVEAELVGRAQGALSAEEAAELYSRLEDALAGQASLRRPAHGR